MKKEEMCDNILEIWEDLPEDATDAEIQKQAAHVAKELVNEKMKAEYGLEDSQKGKDN